MLRQQFPGTQFEIVNASIMGVNSHAIRPNVEECAARQPDLFIMYMGNNEAVGYCAPGAESPRSPPSLAVIRAGLWMKSMRVGQWFDCIMSGRSPSATTQDAAFFRRQYVATDDPRRLRVMDHFGANLRDMCRVAAGQGVRTLLATVAVNVKDQPPLGSLHRTNLSDADLARWDSEYTSATRDEDRGDYSAAIDGYHRALAIDDHFADLQFRLARCYWAVGKFDAARDRFRQARYWDALAFRADPRLNEIVRTVAGENAGAVRLVDVEQALAACPESEQGLPGKDLFYEHVHLRFAGNYQVARAMLPAASKAVAEILGTSVAPVAEVPSQAACAEQLALTPWDEFRGMAAMVDLISRPPFTDELSHDMRCRQAKQALDELYLRLGPDVLHAARQVYLRVLESRPGDWQVRLRLGFLLTTLGDTAGAAAQWRQVVTQVPWQADAQAALAQPPSATSEKAMSRAQASFDPQALAAYQRGVELFQQRRNDEAIVEFRRAVERSPSVCSFQNNLGAALFRAGRFEEAKGPLTKAIELNANHGGAHLNLALAHLQRGQMEAAVEHLRQAAALKQCPPQMLGQMAWILATSEDGRLRHAEDAVRYAAEACRQTGRKMPELLDIEGAALAAAGRFDDAVRSAVQAIDLAANLGKPQLADQIRAHLAQYKAGKAVR